MPVLQTNWRLDGEGSTVSVFQVLLKAASRGQRNHKPVSNSVQVFRILHPFFNVILLFNFILNWCFHDLFLPNFKVTKEYSYSPETTNTTLPNNPTSLIPYISFQRQICVVYVCVSPCLLPWSESVNHSVVSDSLRPHGL